MRKELFDTIVEDLHRYLDEYGINEMKKILALLCEKYPEIGYQTMFSLVNYEQRRDKKFAPRQNLEPIAMQWYKDQNIDVLTLARKYNIPAPALIRHLVHRKTSSKETAKKWLKNPNQCEDGRLAWEIMNVNLYDLMEGTFYNQLSMTSGMAFEEEIRARLIANRVSFMTEEQLRDRNYDVTPDFRLNIPLVLIRSKNSVIIYRCNDQEFLTKNQEGEEERTIIAWIECKAFFASIECHIEYHQNQYYSYINRFGNGLVLYRFGFVQQEAIPEEFRRNLVLAQQLPPFG